MKPKPRIYWQYYHASRRGYWRVSLTPKGHEYPSLWVKANMAAYFMNCDVERRIAYRAEYAKQLQLRKTG